MDVAHAVVRPSLVLMHREGAFARRGIAAQDQGVVIQHFAVAQIT
jgi:hypothetical protein